MKDGLSVALAGSLGALTLEVAFDIPTGMTALVGRSGSGKTTILRCLAGLERLPGRIQLGADPWQDDKHFVAPEKRRVGMVFQGENLLSHMSVRGNLNYAARRAADPSAIADVASPMGIAHLLDRPVVALSGGETQRVAIARALLIRPRLLLLDEPLSALDGTSRLELARYLERLLPTLQIPILLVSHDLADLSSLAERRITIEAGRIADPRP